MNDRRRTKYSQFVCLKLGWFPPFFVHPVKGIHLCFPPPPPLTPLKLLSHSSHLTFPSRESLTLLSSSPLISPSIPPLPLSPSICPSRNVLTSSLPHPPGTPRSIPLTASRPSLLIRWSWEVFDKPLFQGMLPFLNYDAKKRVGGGRGRGGRHTSVIRVVFLFVALWCQSVPAPAHLFLLLFLSFMSLAKSAAVPLLRHPRLTTTRWFYQPDQGHYPRTCYRGVGFLLG